MNFDGAADGVGSSNLVTRDGNKILLIKTKTIVTCSQRYDWKSNVRSAMQILFYLLLRQPSQLSPHTIGYTVSHHISSVKSTVK